MIIYVIGESLSRQGDGRPLSGPSGDRLADLCGVSRIELRRRFTLLNLCAGYAWSSTGAAAGRRRLMSRVQHGDYVLLLGRKVEGEFTTHRQPFFEHWFLGDTIAKWYTTPHPSGLSHWWNEPRNVEQARRFWKGVISWTQSSDSSTPS